MYFTSILTLLLISNLAWNAHGQIDTDFNPNDRDNQTLLENLAGTHLSVVFANETARQKKQRLNNLVPSGGLVELFDPLRNAKCFNDDYLTDFLAINQLQLYQDFKIIFNWGFQDTMGSPLQTTPEDGLLYATVNRFPGMMLRMCFHDNTIDPTKPDFRDYIRSKIRVGQQGRKRWFGPQTYLETSGADASVLVCKPERYHPNNDDHKTASRVLYALQSTRTGVVDGNGNGINMVDKYKLSYADLLHNGCVAASLYLRPDNVSDEFISQNLAMSPMKFGRRDACRYRWSTRTRRSLCGPSEILPGLFDNRKTLVDWFVTRGMNPCQFAALMVTHSLIEDVPEELKSKCPMMRLLCTSDANEEVDYFKYFLLRGDHQPNLLDGSCVWDKGHWPLTFLDCNLSHDELVDDVDPNVIKFKNAIERFGIFPVYNVLRCALSMLGGRGNSSDCSDIPPDPGLVDCFLIGTDEVPSHHKFGAFFGLP